MHDFCFFQSVLSVYICKICGFSPNSVNEDISMLYVEFSVTENFRQAQLLFVMTTWVAPKYFPLKTHRYQFSEQSEFINHKQIYSAVQAPIFFIYGYHLSLVEFGTSTIFAAIVRGYMKYASAPFTTSQDVRTPPLLYYA